MMNKLRAYLKTKEGQRVIYEVKSFAMTFSAVLVGLVGAENFSSLDAVLSAKDLILSSLGLAASRTLIIYLLNVSGLGDYRSGTKNFK